MHNKVLCYTCPIRYCNQMGFPLFIEPGVLSELEVLFQIYETNFNPTDGFYCNSSDVINRNTLGNFGGFMSGQ
jgi:hypothetical protein